MNKFLILWVVVEGANDLLVDRDGKHFLLLELILVTFVTFYDSQAFLFIEANLRRHQEDFREKVLLLENAVVVGLLQVILHFWNEKKNYKKTMYFI